MRAYASKIYHAVWIIETRLFAETARDKVHQGIEVAREIGNGPEITTNIPKRRNSWEKYIKDDERVPLRCALLKITSDDNVDTRLPGRSTGSRLWLPGFYKSKKYEEKISII